MPRLPTALPFTVALTAALALAAPALAGEHADEISALQHKSAALLEAEASGIITAAQREQAVAPYLARAHALDPAIASVADLQAVPAGPATPVERRTAGLLSALDSSRVIAGVLGVLCFAVLAGYYIRQLRRLFASIPLLAYELGLYALSLAAIVGGSRIPAWGHFLSFIGCLGLAASILLGARIRHAAPRWPRFFLTLVVLWAPVALWLPSPLVGFLVAMALMGALGFSGAMTPLCYAIGFEDEQSALRATVVGFLLVLAFGAMRALGRTVPALAVFEHGALFMGSLVGSVGVLILSSRWYRRSRAFYVVMQLVALAAGVLAIGAGSVFGIGELQKIGGTFFCLWLVEKVSEVPVRTARGWAALGLAAAVGVYLGAASVQQHLDLVRPYLLVP